MISTSDNLDFCRSLGSICFVLQNSGWKSSLHHLLYLLFVWFSRKTWPKQLVYSDPTILLSTWKPWDNPNLSWATCRCIIRQTCWITKVSLECSKRDVCLNTQLVNNKYTYLVYTTQVNSAFHACWLASSEVISEYYSPLSSRRQTK